MYARELDGRTLTFAVSGMLWKRSLVMQDEETGSLWSHLLGECMRGPLEGKQLEQIPSAMTDWETWKTKHPGTTAVTLDRTARRYRRRLYRNPEKFVVGLVEQGEPKAWPFDELHKQPVVNDTHGGRPILVVFEKKSGTAFIYDRRVDGRELHFALQDGRLVDRETESRWDWATGRATAGTLKGEQLEPLPAVVSFRRAWREFHPRSAYWTAQ